VTELLLLLHAGATLWMVGLIWFVQIVHYPLMASVGQEQCCAYSLAHQKRTTLVVGPPMLVELVTAVGLVLAGFGVLAWIGLGLIAVNWISTAAVQVPCHHRLTKGFDAKAHRRLVATNWVRTIAWSARGIIAIALLHSAL